MLEHDLAGGVTSLEQAHALRHLVEWQSGAYQRPYFALRQQGSNLLQILLVWFGQHALA